jgi:hypothetical protein
MEFIYERYDLLIAQCIKYDDEIFQNCSLIAFLLRILNKQELICLCVCELIEMRTSEPLDEKSKQECQLS